MDERKAIPGPCHPADDAPRLDAERLDVYRVALEFQTAADEIAFPSRFRDLRDQLLRASTSIVLNIAEGAGRQTAADKARFYAIARGSAMECAAILDIARARGVAPALTCADARVLLVRIVQMLTRMCQNAVVSAEDVH